MWLNLTALFKKRNCYHCPFVRSFICLNLIGWLYLWTITIYNKIYNYVSGDLSTQYTDGGRQIVMPIWFVRLKQTEFRSKCVEQCEIRFVSHFNDTDLNKCRLFFTLRFEYKCRHLCCCGLWYILTYTRMYTFMHTDTILACIVHTDKKVNASASVFVRKTSCQATNTCHFYLSNLKRNAYSNMRF